MWWPARDWSRPSDSIASFPAPARQRGHSLQPDLRARPDGMARSSPLLDRRPCLPPGASRYCPLSREKPNETDPERPAPAGHLVAPPGPARRPLHPEQEARIKGAHPRPRSRTRRSWMRRPNPGRNRTQRIRRPSSATSSRATRMCCSTAPPARALGPKPQADSGALHRLQLPHRKQFDPS